MFFSLDYQSRLPIYEQLYQSVVKMAALESGIVQEHLPSVRNLAAQLGVNPNTVQKAYAMLERDGIIVTVPGKGAFLARENPAIKKLKEDSLADFRTLVQKMKDYGVPKEDCLSLLEEIYTEKGGEKND